LRLLSRLPSASIPRRYAEGGGLNKYQGYGADCFQRPLRSRFRQQLIPSVKRRCAPLNGASWLRPALVARRSRAGGAQRRLTTAGANIGLIVRDPWGVLALDRYCSARPVKPCYHFSELTREGVRLLQGGQVMEQSETQPLSPSQIPGHTCGALRAIGSPFVPMVRRPVAFSRCSKRRTWLAPRRRPTSIPVRMRHT
jgi:hypothetical protein